MCFYFGLPSERPKLSKRFQRVIANEALFTPSDRYNGFAHPLNAIIAQDTQDLITHAYWGLLPTWAHEKSYAKNTLNARIETLDQLPSFRPYLENRCLIPAAYFFDWRHEGKNKIPYQIFSQENELFSFAGLYNDWQHPDSKEIMRTYTIITTEANDTMKYVHNTKNRMPVILHEKDENAWLNGDSFEKYAFPYSVSLLALEVKNRAV